MKPYKKKIERERIVSAPGKVKAKDRKLWKLEYRWLSLSDYNTFPKRLFSDGEAEYNQEWRDNGPWSRYKTPQGAEESLKKDLRSSWMMRFIKGREWRVRNIETNEVVNFPNIQTFYE